MEHNDYSFTDNSPLKYCGMKPMPEDLEYTIRDKVYIVSLYHDGEGEPPFQDKLVFANSVEHAMSYYHKYGHDWPKHKAISIALNGEILDEKK